MKILLAVDGSDYATAAAAKCCDMLALEADTELRIVSVADVMTTVGASPFGVGTEYQSAVNDELVRAADAHVGQARDLVRERLGEGRVRISTEVMRGSPKSLIVEMAGEWGADLIVVGSQGYGFFERMLIGSVSDAVLHHAPCSVLVVKVAANEVGSSGSAEERRGGTS